MNFRLSGIKLAPDSFPADWTALAAKELGLPRDALRRAKLSKKSVDARDKSDIKILVNIDFEADEKWRDKIVRSAGRHAAAPLPEPERVVFSAEPGARRPVVVGLGPAGLFAALALAEAGLRPIVVERGRDVDSRARDVSAFWGGGALKPNSNVQFGEGGAGAFSDGKLNTGISDARCAYVLETFYQHGAPEEILYQARPHLGTDNLPRVVKSIRERILRLGGAVRFETLLTELILDGGRLIGAKTRDAEGREATLETDTLILALGHSARDSFETLFRQGVPMQAKAFSIGARIEHRQALIDRAQYGAFAGHPALGAAEYRLNCKTAGGRGVYTFCMCPGGRVVAAASEAGGVVTNGMSAFLRDGENANSALLVGVEPADYGDGSPLSGVRFQREWERKAFKLGGADYRAPAQRVGDFLRGIPSSSPGDLLPSYLPGVNWTDLGLCLPPFVAQALREGIQSLDRRLHGFASPGACLTGVETRSSSPLRILRGADCQSAIRGLYPCGEGAGYAGGILSAAVDGLRCAQAAMEPER